MGEPSPLPGRFAPRFADLLARLPPPPPAPPPARAPRAAAPRPHGFSFTAAPSPLQALLQAGENLLLVGLGPKTPAVLDILAVKNSSSVARYDCGTLQSQGDCAALLRTVVNRALDTHDDPALSLEQRLADAPAHLATTHRIVALTTVDTPFLRQHPAAFLRVLPRVVGALTRTAFVLTAHSTDGPTLFSVAELLRMRVEVVHLPPGAPWVDEPWFEHGAPHRAPASKRNKQQRLRALFDALDPREQQLCGIVARSPGGASSAAALFRAANAAGLYTRKQAVDDQLKRLVEKGLVREAAGAFRLDIDGEFVLQRTEQQKKE